MNTIFKKELSLEMVDFPASYFRLQEGVQFDQIDRLGLGQVSSLFGLYHGSHGGTNGSSFSNMFSGRIFIRFVYIQQAEYE